MAYTPTSPGRLQCIHTHTNTHTTGYTCTHTHTHTHTVQTDTTMTNDKLATIYCILLRVITAIYYIVIYVEIYTVHPLLVISSQQAHFT